MGDANDLADSLGLERFHLLTHATGGMVGFRYAMQQGDRVISIMATNTAAATLPMGSDDGKQNYKRNTNIDETSDTETNNVTLTINWEDEAFSVTSVSSIPISPYN